jgi:glycosyltransferase involved in cell wall biosynthesis
MHQTKAEMSAQAWCTIVVPCYNEAARLQTDKFIEFLSTHTGVRFLFVNDGSTDETLTLLNKLAETDPEHILVLDQQPNAGKAEAVRSGMLAKADESSIVGFWDADLATPLDALPEFLTLLRENPEVEMVFGARVRLLGRHVERRPVRHYLGRVFASLVSIMLQLPIYDTQCGAKVFRVSSDLHQVLAQPFETRWIFDVEIIARFLALHRSEPEYRKLAIYEHPLNRWVDIAGSKVKPLDFITSFLDLMRIGFRYYR